MTRAMERGKILRHRPDMCMLAHATNTIRNVTASVSRKFYLWLTLVYLPDPDGVLKTVITPTPHLSSPKIVQ
jgi:hypothetical protein